MKNKYMIVSDLDGTLLNFNSKCSLKTKKHLKQLKEEGHVIVIATGRVLNSSIRALDGTDYVD